jgi:hypothetical protein
MYSIDYYFCLLHISISWRIDCQWCIYSVASETAHHSVGLKPVVCINGNHVVGYFDMDLITLLGTQLLDTLYMV